MEITSDQRELQDLVRRFLQDAVPSEYLRKRVTSGLRRDEALNESLKSLGLEEGFAQDGGLTFAELGLVAEEVGRALFPEPLLERLLGDCIVPGVLSETSKAAYAALGSGTAFAPSSCCELSYNAKTKKVSGEISWVLGVEGATRLIGSMKHGKGVRLFTVALKQAGVAVKAVPSLDLTAALSSLSLKDVSVVVLSEEESRTVTDLYEVLKACEVYGITSRVVEMSAEYLKTREQFGVPIGAFQALQQRLADAYAQSESLGALSRFAAWSVPRSPEQLPLTARAAISQASEVGPAVCEAAIQVHGGIGFTWEYDLHLYLRRAKVTQSAFSISGGRVDELLDRARTLV
jgi:alkylation response protein AidB-like acyl-CoA dehydrogenase